MNLYESWLKPSTEVWRDKHPRAGLYEFYSRPYEKAIELVQRNVIGERGDRIYDFDWDLLVIVDACRADLMGKLLETEEYPFVQDSSVAKSTGSNTYDWMRSNFVDDVADAMAETTYVCGNPFSDDLLDRNSFRELIEVWRHSWSESAGTLPPRPITDEAIRQGRQMEGGRLLVHYMQPHCPFLTGTSPANGKSLESWPISPGGDVWTLLGYGEVSKAEVWRSYRQNLEIVMDEVELLLENTDAENAVVASDHGNGFGEYGIYGHPKGMPFDFVRDVPWIEVKARDENTHAPGSRRAVDADVEVQDRLESLGYLS